MKKFVLIMSILMSFLTYGKSEKVTLTSDNTVVLWGPVIPELLQPVINKIKELDSKLKSNYPIYLVLNTPGGIISEGSQFIDFVNSLHRPVHTITLFAASMGFQMVQQLGTRYIIEYGELMSHKARGGFSGEFGGNGLSQLDSRYTMWLRKLQRLDEKTVSRTNGKQTLRSYRAAYENELWLNGWEAVNKGYADAIAKITCNSTLSGIRELRVKRRFGTLVATFQACPLYTGILGIRAEIATNQGGMDVDAFIMKGGKVGKGCRKDESVKYDYNNNKKKVRKELCSLNTTIDLGKIVKEKKLFKGYFVNVKQQTNKYKMVVR